MARGSALYSDSSSSTLSCINCIFTEEESTGVLETSPSTPPTSITDAASVSSSDVSEPSTDALPIRRVQRVRTSIHSYNENILSGSARRDPIRRITGGESRNISGQTLVLEDEVSRMHTTRNNIQVSNLDRKPDSMPRGETKQARTTNEGLKLRKPKRSNVLERALNVVERTKSVLVTRSQEATKHGKEKSEEQSRKSTLRPRTQAKVSFQAPVEKQMRMAAETIVKGDPRQVDAKRKAAMQPKAKRWLSQGLYVGQERDFNPRLTEAKNKLRRVSAEKRLDRQSSILPLPMFAGERTLDIGRDFKLPFYIFSPLSPRQPRPEEWRKTQKNVFVGDAAESWKKSKRLEHSTCICDISSGCDENCLNRFMFYECDDTNCNIGTNYCTNRSFEDLRQRYKAGGKYNIGVEVIKTIDRGHGVRSNRTFDPSQIIVEYTGEIITQDECDNRMRQMYKDNECFYLMVFDQNMIIDATRGSIARFINHSCEPNCKMIKWTVAGKPRMALFAGERGVMTGEELTYDYNFDPFSSKNIQECRCGASTCRGVLGPKPKDQTTIKPKDMKGALQPLVNAGTKRKFHQLVEKSVDLVTSKKRKSVIPSTIAPTLRNLKGRGSVHEDQVKLLTTSNTQKDRLVEKVLKRSLRGEYAGNFRQQNGSKTLRQNSTAHTRILSLNARLPGQPPSPWSSAQTIVSSVRRNAVRTIRSSTRASAGKNIRMTGYKKTNQSQ